jgi:uncharacterized protein (UPF0212 family)
MVTVKSVIHIFETGSAEEVKRQSCPSCGAALRAAYIPGKKASLGVVCPTCRWGFSSDGLAVQPPWVSQVGQKLDTNP